MGHLPIQVLPHRFPLSLRVPLDSGSICAVFAILHLCVLDCAEQRRRQSAVRRLHWSWHDSDYIRLDGCFFVAEQSSSESIICDFKYGLRFLYMHDWSYWSGLRGTRVLQVSTALVSKPFVGESLRKSCTKALTSISCRANKNWDRFAKPYNTSRILTPQYTVNETAYEQYSPILLGATFSLSYAMSFATLISTLTHCALFYGPDIWRRCRNAKSEEPDVHLKLMRRYKEAPEWWFAVIFVLSFVFGMLASQLWETHLPWWAYIVCILIAIVFFIPIGMIQAITNQQPGLNVITEMIFGYMYVLPAVMVYLCYDMG